jgi:hypothetical protein
VNDFVKTSTIYMQSFVVVGLEDKPRLQKHIPMGDSASNRCLRNRITFQDLAQCLSVPSAKQQTIYFLDN